jgi:hypothetical protein
VIIALVVIAGLMIILLIDRPGGSDPSVDRTPGFVGALRELSPHQEVVVNDVAGQTCWSDAGQLVAAPGQGCVTRLPEDADRMRICLAEGELATFAIDGDKYGPQKLDENVIKCDSVDGGQTFDLYDENSVLSLQCRPFGKPCVLRLL